MINEVKEEKILDHVDNRSCIVEPMTIESLDRLCLMPIQRQDLFDNYKKQIAHFWTYDEINHADDYADWCKMNEDEQNYIAGILAFFANSDNAVMENIEKRFKREITWPEAQMALAAQSFFETIHVVSYNNMISAVIKDQDKRLKLFQAVKNDPIVAKKIDWIRKWAGDDDIPLVQCFVAQCISEGVGFGASFASMFWLRKNQKCPGICYGNEKIVDDESLHVKLFALLKAHTITPLSTKTIYEMCQELVDIEHEFVDSRLPYNLKGMNKVMMKQHVCHTADIILKTLNVAPLYGSGPIFDWMEGVGIIGKSNFFEKSVGEYAKTSKEDQINTESFHNLGGEINF